MLGGVLQKSFLENFTKFTEKYLYYSYTVNTVKTANTVKGLQTIRLATLLKRHPHTGVSEPAVCRSSTKQVFLNNSQNSQENTYVRVSFQVKFSSRHSQMFFKIIALKKFANFTGKDLCQSLF